MGQKLNQRVGMTDYRAEYEVRGDNVAVTLDGQTREEPIGNQGALYKARDVLRMMVRDAERQAA